MKWYNIAIIVLVPAICFIAGCDNKHDDNILQKLESARNKAGLRAVSPAWRITSQDRNYVSWGYPGGGRAKQVHFDSKHVIWEEDYYHTGRQYPSLDGEDTSFEMLTLHYDYETGFCAVRVVTDNITLDTAVEGTASETGIELSRAFELADSILSVWKMKR